jgi:hypothetical protein
MSKDELARNLGTIARSGTSEFLKKADESGGADGNLIGQFGRPADLPTSEPQLTSRSRVLLLFPRVTYCSGLFSPTCYILRPGSNPTHLCLHLLGRFIRDLRRSTWEHSRSRNRDCPGHPGRGSDFLKPYQPESAHVSSPVPNQELPADEIVINTRLSLLLSLSTSKKRRRAKCLFRR